MAKIYYTLLAHMIRKLDSVLLACPEHLEIRLRLVRAILWEIVYEGGFLLSLDYRLARMRELPEVTPSDALRGLLKLFSEEVEQKAKG